MEFNIDSIFIKKKSDDLNKRLGLLLKEQKNLLDIKRDLINRCSHIILVYNMSEKSLGFNESKLLYIYYGKCLCCGEYVELIKSEKDKCLYNNGYAYKNMKNDNIYFENESIINLNHGCLISKLDKEKENHIKDILNEVFDFISNSNKEYTVQEIKNIIENKFIEYGIIKNIENKNANIGKMIKAKKL